MKGSVRFSMLIAAALLITLGISGCGGDGRLFHVSGNSTAFAYLVNTNSGGSGAALSSPVAGAARARIALHTRAHTARRPVANASVGLGAGNLDMYIYDTSTGTNTKLNGSYGSAAFYNVQLSNDGTKLLFVAEDTAGYAQIYVADAKLQTITQVTTGTTDHYDATLSADGTMIAYYTYYNSSERDQLYTIPVAGGTPTTILTPNIEAWSPVFTPNGRSLVFTGYNNSSYIYIVNLDGTGLTQLSRGSNWDGIPSVSPDGTKVAFERDNDSGEDIAVMGIGGESVASPVTMLTTNGKNWYPMYLGNKILFLSWKDNPSTNNDNIYEMNADGSNVVRLTNSPLETCFNWYED